MLQQLAAYEQLWSSRADLYATHRCSEEKAMVDHFIQFYRPCQELFLRTHLPGHFTGSALVTNADGSQVLLTLHKKLNMWLQLGGHADGEQQLSKVALREALEESGLEDLTFVPFEKLCGQPLQWDFPIPLDLDCHLVPARTEELAHYHFDAIFLLKADDRAPLAISEESHDLRWFPLEEAFQIASERCLQRQLYKLQALKFKELG